MHTDTVTITFSAHRYQGAPAAIEARIVTETPEEAKAVAALFPKSYGLKGTDLHTRDESGAWVVKGIVQWRASLAADGTNGGVNETGLARYRKTLAKARALGMEVAWEVRFTEAGYATPEALDADLA